MGAFEDAKQPKFMQNILVGYETEEKNRENEHQEMPHEQQEKVSIRKGNWILRNLSFHTFSLYLAIFCLC